MQNPAFHSVWQHTIAEPVSCEGIGLHSGKAVKMTLHPAAPGAGISFLRSDLPEIVSVPADALLVSDTRLGTSLTGACGTRVATVEHLMAALWGMGVDNVKVVLDAPEVPIMDGSSQPFIELLVRAGLQPQPVRREVVEVMEPVRIQIGESRLEILPYDGFMLDIEVDYSHPVIANQTACYDFSECNFGEALAEARTFGFAQEVAMMREMGLARGGSLENAIVVGEEGVLNPEGLRSEDEFVRHKALDCVGDLFLTGYRIRGHVKAYKPGHQINTALAQKLLQQTAKWRLVESDEAELPMPRIPAASEAFYA